MTQKNSIVALLFSFKSQKYVYIRYYREYNFSVNRHLPMVETKKTETGNTSAKKDLDYFGVLKNAFGMVRHNRYLWYLGILAGGGFGSGFNGSGGVPSNFFEQNQGNSAQAASDISLSSADIWEEVFKWLQNNWILVVIIASIVLVLVIVFTILSSMAKAGLVHSVDLLSKNEESSFGEALRFGWHKWWKVFGAGFLIGLVIFGVFAVLSIPVVALWFVSPIFAIFLTLAAILAFFLVIVISGVVFEYTLRYIALKEGRAVASIRNGYGLMKKFKKETFLIWLITVGVAMISGIVVLMAIFLIGLILVLLGLLFFLLAPIAGIIYAGIALIVFVIALFTVGGFISSLLSAYWTLCFKELV